MKNYFVSYVLQEEGKQDIYGNATVQISGRVDTQKLQNKLQEESKLKLRVDERSRKLILLNIVKL